MYKNLPFVSFCFVSPSNDNAFASAFSTIFSARSSMVNYGTKWQWYEMTSFGIEQVGRL
jgi:hypothetical protein